MPKILKFPIPEAYAEPINDGIKVTLIYPNDEQKQYTRERRLSDPADIEFGIGCLEGLLRGDRVRIGTPEHPSRPASGAVLDLFSDGSFLSHRRDGGTKVHPWYNGIPSGFPSELQHLHSISALQRTEVAEESILFEKDGVTIYVPHDIFGRVATEKRIQLLGLRNPVSVIPIEYRTGTDILEIKDETGNLLSMTAGNIYLSWEVETNVAIAGIRFWPLASRQIAAIDAEGVIRDGTFIPFGREKFHIQQYEVANVLFDEVIPMPKRYRLDSSEYILGNNIGHAVRFPARVDEEYHFRPDDGLRRMLDALCIKGWKGNWMQYEIIEAQKRLTELSIR